MIQYNLAYFRKLVTSKATDRLKFSLSFSELAEEIRLLYNIHPSFQMFKGSVYTIKESNSEMEIFAFLLKMSYSYRNYRG